MIYAIILLLGVGFVTKTTLRYFGMTEDANTHFYGSFQNALYAKTLYEVAKKCLSRYDFNHCQRQDFTDGIYSGGYEIFKLEQDYRIEIWVLHQNPRNLHIIRNFVAKKIKKEENASI